MVSHQPDNGVSMVVPGDVLLLYPPMSQFRSPHLAIPLLQAYLQSHGVTCDIRDLNLECFQYFVRTPRLDCAVERVTRRLALGTTHPQAYPMTARLAVEEALLRWERSRPLLDASLEVLSVRRGVLPTAEVIHDANRSIKDAFFLLSAEFYPTRWEEEVFAGSFDASRCDQIVDFAANDNGNPFAEFWNEKALDDSFRLATRRVVGISICFLSQLIGGLTLARRIRVAGGSELPIVIGGPVAMYMQKNPEALRPLFDTVTCIVYGEGEGPLLALHRAMMDNMPLEQVPGIIFRDAEDCVQVTPAAPAPHLSDLPRPTFDQLPLDSYVCNHLELPIFSERGCYYGKCTFCCVDLSPDRRFDSRQSALMVEDMEYYQRALNVTHFLFITTALPALKAKDIATRLCHRELLIRWGSNIRYEDRFTSAILQQMAASGCLMLNVGLESGSDRIVALMKKGFTISQAESFHARARDAGIRIGLYIMLGFPGETKDDRLETATLLTRLGVGLDDLSIGQFVLHEFAPMFENPEAYGIEVHARGDVLAFERSFSYTDGRTVDEDLVAPFQQLLTRMLKEASGDVSSASMVPVTPNSRVVRQFSVSIRKVDSLPVRYLVLSDDDGMVFEMEDEIYVRALEMADGLRSVESIAAQCGQSTDHVSLVVTELIEHGFLKQISPLVLS